MNLMKPKVEVELSINLTWGGPAANPEEEALRAGMLDYLNGAGKLLEQMCQYELQAAAEAPSLLLAMSYRIRQDYLREHGLEAWRRLKVHIRFCEGKEVQQLSLQECQWFHLKWCPGKRLAAKDDNPEISSTVSPADIDLVRAIENRYPELVHAFGLSTEAMETLIRNRQARISPHSHTRSHVHSKTEFKGARSMEREALERVQSQKHPQGAQQATS
jgi:hypothetical protein